MKLFFREYGNGSPLIILHGLYGSSDNWVSIARELSDTFRVILPDMRNHGQSPHSNSHSYHDMSDDICDLADSLGLDKFILAGHSMGGKAAMWFALRWPERLEGLIVLDMSPFKSDLAHNQSLGMHLSILELMKATDPGELENREAAAIKFNSVVKSERITGFLLKNITRDESGRFRWKLNPSNLLYNIDNIMDGVDRSEAVERSVRGFPVLFLRAASSGYITRDEFGDIQRLFPAAEIVTINDTSHWLHAEKPELIIKYIREIAG